MGLIFPLGCSFNAFDVLKCALGRRTAGGTWADN